MIDMNRASLICASNQVDFILWIKWKGISLKKGTLKYKEISMTWILFKYISFILLHHNKKAAESVFIFVNSQMFAIRACIYYNCMLWSQTFYNAQMCTMHEYKKYQYYRFQKMKSIHITQYKWIRPIILQTIQHQSCILTQLLFNTIHQ